MSEIGYYLHELLKEATGVSSSDLTTVRTYCTTNSLTNAGPQIDTDRGYAAAVLGVGKTLSSEAVVGAGALTPTKQISTVANTTSGTYAVTLAAPSGQDGQEKIIKAVATMTHTVTLAMTNIKTAGDLVGTTGVSGTTTLTFTNAGDCAILKAVGSLWHLVGGTAVAS
jgi:hypothetical protein